MEGDDHREAYTAIVRGLGLSFENFNIAEAEAFYTVEGSMCGAVMRGTVAPPESKARSRKKRSRRNLGDLPVGLRSVWHVGPWRKGEEP